MFVSEDIPVLGFRNVGPTALPVDVDVDEAPDDVDEEKQAEMRLLLDQCRKDYDALSDYRDRRRRARDDRRGRQWNRTIEDPDNPGQYITEKQLIERQGRIAWQMNHIAPVVRNLKGQYLENQSERMAYARDREDNDAAEMMTVALRSVRKNCNAGLVEPDQLEEHIIGGMQVWRIGAAWDSELDRNEVQVESVPPVTVFFNSDIGDRNMRNLRRIGVIHDLTIEDIIHNFAQSPEDEQRIIRIYADRSEPYLDERQNLGFDASDLFDFQETQEAGIGRVYEVWRREQEWRIYAEDPITGRRGLTSMDKEEIEQYNAQRIAIGLLPVEWEWKSDLVWKFYFLAPDGSVIHEGDNPYWHQSHPFVVGFASFFDEEWWGLVEDIQDPQRLVNRLTSAIDHMITASAKGVLIVDQEVLDQSGISIDEIADDWTSFNGVLALRLRQDKRIDEQVKQITANAIPAGMFQWLSAQKEWIEELSGVMGPQVGKTPPSGTPAALYAQQQLQSSLTTLTYFHTHFNTLYSVDRKVLQCILQYFEERRNIATSEQSPVVMFEPERVRDIDWDIVVGESADTQTFRMQFENSLMEFLNAGHVTFRQFLQMSSHPKAQQILKIVERTNPLLNGADASMMGTNDPNMFNALLGAASAGDMEARVLLNQSQDLPQPIA